MGKFAGEAVYIALKIRQILTDPANFEGESPSKKLPEKFEGETVSCSNVNTALKMYESHAFYSCIRLQRLQTNNMFII